MQGNAGAKLRIGLIGAGDISKNHLAAWRKVAGATVVAVCDVDKARARARAEAFEIPAVYADAAAMFAGERTSASALTVARTTLIGLREP